MADAPLAAAADTASAAGPAGAADPEAIASWLTELGIEHSRPLTLSRTGLGQSNLTYAVEDRAGRRWILRRPPLGGLLASAHDVAREARILHALRDTDVPVPRVLGAKTDTVLMELVDGMVLDQPGTVLALPSRTRHAIGLSLAATLAKVHAVDLAKTGLSAIASHRPYAERQLRRWSAQWTQSSTWELPALDELTARLWKALPAQREVTLVHGDFHLRNLIVSGDDAGTIRSVLDWELCTLGDPLADLGSLLAYWQEPGEAAVSVLGLSSLSGFPSRVQIADAYLKASGRDAGPLGFWHALGLWKIAIMAAGVLRRALDEPRNRAGALTPSADQIEALITRARDVAAGSGI